MALHQFYKKSPTNKSCQSPYSTIKCRGNVSREGSRIKRQFILTKFVFIIFRTELKSLNLMTALKYVFKNIPT